MKKHLPYLIGAVYVLGFLYVTSKKSKPKYTEQDLMLIEQEKDFY